MRKLIPALAIALIALSSGSSLGATTPNLSGYAAKAGGTIIDVPIPSSILNTALVDQNGKSFTLGSLKGKTVVLTDFMTTCNDICPMTTVNMRDMASHFAAKNLASSIVSLELSIDSKRDTPSRMKVYQDLYGAHNWTLATSSVANLASIWKWFGVYTKVVPSDEGVKDWQTGKPVTYDLDHADVVIVIGPNSHWRYLNLASPAVNNPKASHVLPAKIEAFLSASGKVNLTNPAQPFWTTGSVYSALNEIYGLKL